MKTSLLFITNVPSFYKIRLFNEISKSRELIVLFVEDAREQRDADFFSGEMKYRYFQVKSGKAMLWKMLYFLTKIKFNEVIIDGWDRLVTFFIPFVVSRKKVACLIESSIYESKLVGWKAILKKAFLGRCTCAYCSGIAQERLALSLGFKGKIIKFGGCGLLRYKAQPQYEKRDKVKKFLYVGRLSPEKNLRLLVKVFKRFPNLSLDIIGYGPIEKELKSMASQNVCFLGAVKNEDLYSHYCNADVFVLPSITEPWGLVVEEALNCGTPVIVSDKVGCREDLVTKDTGIVFEYNNAEALCNAIKEIQQIERYNKLRYGVAQMDFLERAQKQVNSFVANRGVKGNS